MRNFHGSLQVIASFHAQYFTAERKIAAMDHKTFLYFFPLISSPLFYQTSLKLSKLMCLGEGRMKEKVLLWSKKKKLNEIKRRSSMMFIEINIKFILHESFKSFLESYQQYYDLLGLFFVNDIFFFSMLLQIYENVLYDALAQPMWS